MKAFIRLFLTLVFVMMASVSYATQSCLICKVRPSYGLSIEGNPCGRNVVFPGVYLDFHRNGDNDQTSLGGLKAHYDATSQCSHGAVYVQSSTSCTELYDQIIAVAKKVYPNSYTYGPNAYNGFFLVSDDNGQVNDFDKSTPICKL